MMTTRVKRLRAADRGTCEHEAFAASLMRVTSIGRFEMVAGESDVGHSHPDQWEIMVQADGVGREHFGGKSFAVQPGDVMIYPAHSRHGTHNQTAHTIHQYVIHFEADGAHLAESSDRLRSGGGRPVCRLGRDGLAWFEQVFNQLLWEDAVRHEGYAVVQDALLRLMLVGFDRRKLDESSSFVAQPRPDVLRFVNYVRDSIGETSPLTVAAARMGTNYDSLRHRFKQEIGTSPKRFLMNLRVQQAKHLLLTTRLSIKEISDRLGYADPHHFTAAFTRYTGRAPLHWRLRPEIEKG